MQPSWLRKGESKPLESDQKKQSTQSPDEPDTILSSDGAIDSTAELLEGVSLTANTETNKKGSLLSEDPSQDERGSAQTSQSSTAGGEVSSLASTRSFDSNSPADESAVHTQVRRELWTEAYENLKREEPVLVDAYESFLSLRLDEDTGATTVVAATQKNNTKNMEFEERQQFLKDITETTLKKFETVVASKQYLNDSEENLELVNKVISSIKLGAEEVAFVWVGVCLSLEMLFQPVTSQSLHHDVTAFLISKMNAYWHMSSLLMDENRTIETIGGNLENDIIRLYTTVLSWQMKSICAYYQQQWNMFLQDLPSVEYWNLVKHRLLSGEGAVFSNPGLENSWQVVHYLQGLANTGLSHEAKLRDMRLGCVPTICPACGNLDPRIWGTEMHSTYVMDVRHAASECTACMVIVRGFIAIVKPLEEKAKLIMTARQELSLIAFYEDYVGKRSAAIEFFVRQGDPSPWKAIRPARSLRSSMRPNSMELVSEWFNQCFTQHRTCKGRESTLPTRVVYVGNDIREPYLYQTSGEEAPYSALSHCWGSAPTTHLTSSKANLKDRMESIPISTLSQTFSDAVVLTRRLGIEYIWIDSLCIIQDDTEDWARESARMCEVYRNAALTISADGASDGSKGLFQTIHVPLHQEISMTFKSSTGSGVIYARESDLGQYADRVHTIPDKNDDPLRQRGWALQEWLLPSRIVHFTIGELLWECKESQSCECQVNSQLSKDIKGPVSPHRRKSRFYRERESDGGGLYLHWTRVVHEFTRRKLTIQTDRLPALSGLAAFNTSNAAEDYVAGLWKSELPETLLWQVRGDDSERHEDYYAPSWSWASVNGDIGMHSTLGNRLPMKCKILEISTVLATDNPFGPLKSGFIKIQGPVAILSQNMMRMGEPYDSGETQYDGKLTLDVKGPALEVTPGDEILFLILEKVVTISGIALKKVKDDGQYMRVGFVQIDCDDKDWDSWMQKIKTQIVTIV